MKVARGGIFKVGQYFSSREFDCRCSFDGCTMTEISDDLVEKLDLIRELAQRPIRINSGYRCQRRQEELRAKGLETAKGISAHELGLAADISAQGLTGLELERLAIAAGFKRIGVSETWIHVDLKNSGTARWAYGAPLQSAKNA